MSLRSTALSLRNSARTALAALRRIAAHPRTAGSELRTIKLDLPQVKLDWYDTIGAGIVAVFAVWILFSAVVAGGDPIPQVILLVGAAAAYVAGRHFGTSRLRLERTAGAVLLAIVLGVLLSGPSVASGRALAPPLGYGNANGALYVLAIGAAAMLALSTRQPAVRAAAGLLAVLFALLTVATHSKAAVVLALGVLLVASIAHRFPLRWAVLLGPLVVATTLTVTVVLGLAHGGDILPGLVARLSERRTQLWYESLEIMAVNPLFGAGPGGFEYTSQTAIDDRDASWAHSAYLQVGAELGVLGLLLLLLLLAWVYGALYRSRHKGRLVPVTAAVITAIAVHATIDYIIHFPAIVPVTALLAGLASSRPTVSPTAPATQAGPG